MDQELAYTDLFDLQRRGMGAVAVVEAVLERIEEIDSVRSSTAVRSVLAVSSSVLDEARAQDGDGGVGPLAGVAVLVKDNIEVDGHPSCAGATSLLDRPATADAPLVERLKRGGALVVGTTNLSEWANIRSARSTAGWSAVGGLTANPWALDRSAGGSSSGSGAALAAGLASIAIGTETDGSIVCPASLNGVAGIKPAVGTVPSSRIVPISSSQDCPGPMARTVDEVALALEVLASKSGILDRARGGVRGMAVAVARTWRTGHPETDALFDETVVRLQGAGAELHFVDAAAPGPSVEEDELVVLLCELFDGLGEYLPTRGRGGPQSLAEVVAHEKAQAELEMEFFGHDLFERALELGGTGNRLYAEARRRNLEWALEQCLAPALDGCEVLVAPTFGPAWKSDLVLGGHPALASPFTTAPAIAGWPVATAPMGQVGGLPVGIGALGRPGSEALLLAVCRAVEQPAPPAWRQPARG